jgi:hypothetical protein
VDEDGNERETIVFGRIYEAYAYRKGKDKKTEEYYAGVDGDCAWSFQSAILDNGLLQKIIKKYKITAEVYTEEPGVGFMEHYVWEEGELVVDECRDFTTFNIYDIEDEEDLDFYIDNDIMKGHGITKENYQEFADEDGYIRIGGFQYNWSVN